MKIIFCTILLFCLAGSPCLSCDVKRPFPQKEFIQKSLAVIREKSEKQARTSIKGLLKITSELYADASEAVNKKSDGAAPKDFFFNYRAGVLQALHLPVNENNVAAMVIMGNHNPGLSALGLANVGSDYVKFLRTAFLVWVGPAAVYRPINVDFEGITMFRGNATHTYYGKGPVPDTEPEVLWIAPLSGMDGWNGTGWTGQPVVIEWPDKSKKRMFPKGEAPDVEVIVGGLGGKVYFFDALTGKQSRRPIGKPIPYSVKSSVTVDPDGYPFLYFGSRKHGYWIFSLIDLKPLADVPAAYNPQTWTRVGYWPDCDGSGVIINDYLFIGMENGWLYRVKLNRQAKEGRSTLTIDRKKDIQAVDTRYLTPLGKEAMRKSGGYCSIESSPAVFEDKIYVSSGSGMVYGLDAYTLKPFFNYFTGDDTDASIVVDEKGFIYTACQIDWSRRGKAYLYKLDPTVPMDKWEDALVWKYEFDARPAKGKKKIDDIDGGVLGSPALGYDADGKPDGRVYLTTTNRPFSSGSIVAIDRNTGIAAWKHDFPVHVWSSPAVVDGRVIVADANGGVHAFNSKTGEEIWCKKLKATLESTPVVWKNRIYVGGKNGYFYCLGIKKEGTALDEKNQKNN